MEFWVELSSDTYQKNLGWNCSALNLPGAKVGKMLLAGTAVDLALFAIEGTQIRFLQPPTPIPKAHAQIELNRRLARMDATIVVAAIGLLGTIATAIIGSRSADKPKSTEPSLTAVQRQETHRCFESLQAVRGFVSHGAITPSAVQGYVLDPCEPLLRDLEIQASAAEAKGGQASP